MQSKDTPNAYADVAVELPVQRPFTYAVPPALARAVTVGRRVVVPFGKRTVTGYVVRLHSSAPANKLKEIADVLDDGPLFDARRLSFYEWAASYYFAPLGEVLSMLPPRGSGVASFRRLRAALGHDAAERPPSGKLETDILAAASKGIGFSALVRRHRGRPVGAAVERLKKAGLLIEEVAVPAAKGPRTEKIVTAIDADDGALRALQARAPSQAALYSYLKGHPDARLSELTGLFPGASAAIARLEEKGLVTSARVESRDAMKAEIAPRSLDHEPTAEQKSAIAEIASAVSRGGFNAFLLFGVTGSGKTLVYLHAIEEALRAGGRALYLVPEIALTLWPAAYLDARFPGRVAVLHSAMTDAERYAQWRRIVTGSVDVVVGPRSALFCPIDGLSLIIVDEEHETSYKQEEGVKYHGRDAALMLGKKLGITVVLGSATPSVESFYNALKGKLRLLTMEARAAESSSLPSVELLDMRGGKRSVISGRLKDLLCRAVSSGSQALLFINRRGLSGSLLCRRCGWRFKCLNCSVSLTLHRDPPALLCHYCGFTVPAPRVCPSCASPDLFDPGAGTEKVEEEARALLPDSTVLRMDGDSSSKRSAVGEMITRMESGEVDVLVGTQMVSKGHHFPGMALVGIIAGDLSLNIPDFRSAERTFQIITQAAGRAGRGATPGEVVIQTVYPEHYSFRSAVNHDYRSFYEEEIRLRKDLFYPPFSRLAVLRLDGVSEARVRRAGEALKAEAERLKKGGRFHAVAVLGPAPALLSKLKGRHRRQILLKAASASELHDFAAALKRRHDEGNDRAVRLTVDIDPLSSV